jgi:hypothetical protein
MPGEIGGRQVRRDPTRFFRGGLGVTENVRHKIDEMRNLDRNHSDVALAGFGDYFLVQ